MAIVGQFRDLDQPDRFVWIRGFPSMPARARALAGFYGGPARGGHSAPAHAPQDPNDEALLLRPRPAPPRLPAPPPAPLPAGPPPPHPPPHLLDLLLPQH